MFSDETMTVETFFGCAFLAYGLPLALFALTIAKVGYMNLFRIRGPLRQKLKFLRILFS